MSRAVNNALLAGVVGAGAWLLWQAYRASTRYSFANKVVLVTGGSRGLGLVIARKLAREGARIAICGRDFGSLQEAAAELRQAGAEVLTVATDVGDPKQVESLLGNVVAHFGRIDVLINNAGTIAVGPLETMTPDDFHDALNTNFWGAVHTVNAALPYFRAQKAGRIVNVASIGGLVPIPHMVPYTASKFALVGYTEALRAELGKAGIAVTLICPGLTTTGSPRNATYKGQHRAEYAWFALSDANPLIAQSAEGAADEILEACRYGESVRVLTWPAKLMALAHSLMPGVYTDIQAVVNRLLPGPGGVGTHGVPGRESQSTLTQSPLAAADDAAAARNNQGATVPT